MPVTTTSLAALSPGWSVTAVGSQGAAPAIDGTGTGGTLTLTPRFEDGAPAIYQFTDAMPGVANDPTATFGLAFNMNLGLNNASGATFTDFVVDLLLPYTTGNPMAGDHPIYSHFHPNQTATSLEFSQQGYKVDYTTTSQTLTARDFNSGNRVVLSNNNVETGTAETWDDGRVHQFDQTFFMIVTPIEQADFASESFVDLKTLTHTLKTEHFSPNVAGTFGNDLLYGSDTYNNVMNGQGGHDLILGTGGDDTINGGDGVDRLFGGADNDTLNGGFGRDWIDGGRGHDILNGDDGADVMKGGAGDDTYHVDNALDSVIERSGDGTDTANSSVDYTLTQFTENLTLTGSAFRGTGTDSANRIDGNDSANFIEGHGGNDNEKGYAGNDEIYGGNGNDTIVGDAGDDMLNGQGDSDTIFGGADNDDVRGGAGKDTLRGESGSDRMFGGRDKDHLYGGTSGDRFDFDGVIDAGLGSSRDIIYDFSKSEGDKIDLVDIDAKSTASGNQAFSFIGTKAFSAAGQLRANDLGSTVILQGSTDADKAAEFEIEVRNFTGSFTINEFYL